MISEAFHVFFAAISTAMERSKNNSEVRAKIVLNDLLQENTVNSFAAESVV